MAPWRSASARDDETSPGAVQEPNLLRRGIVSGLAHRGSLGSSEPAAGGGHRRTRPGRRRPMPEASSVSTEPSTRSSSCEPRRSAIRGAARCSAQTL
jgi:hypothetical protein